ncbi:MAG TPA: hypothetical protein VHT75_12670 [Acidimicrobiales bacterium]|jgi:hypothetical protein|nr:hypothetical protein [Acidimicrobiales bacterium]
MDAALHLSSVFSVAPSGGSTGVSGGTTLPAADTDSQRLREQIAAARRRVVEARIALAAAADPETAIIWRAQQRLVGEGYVATDARYSPSGFSASGQLGDSEMLRFELDRVRSLATTLERQVDAGRAGSGARSGVSASAALAVLEEFVAGALETLGADEARGHHASAVARTVQPFLPVDSRLGTSLGNRPAMGGAAPLPDSIPNFAPLADDRHPEWGSDEPTGPVATVAADSASAVAPWERTAASRPMILDVILPLIAVAIVLLVVLSWVG